MVVSPRRALPSSWRHGRFGEGNERSGRTLAPFRTLPARSEAVRMIADSGAEARRKISTGGKAFAGGPLGGGGFRPQPPSRGTPATDCCAGQHRDDRRNCKAGGVTCFATA